MKKLKENFNNQVGLRGQYFEELQALRGLAVLLVFLFHWHGVSFSLGRTVQDVSLLYAFVVSGSTGVTLFFVLSGFLLTFGLFQGKEKSPQNFLRDRFLRIVPLYWLVILVAVLLTGELVVALKALFFQFIGFGMFPFGVVLWTLATEVQFYFALLLYFYLRAFISHKQLYVLLSVLIGSYLFFFVFGYAANSGGGYWLTKSLLGRWPAFFVGILVAYLFVKKDSYLGGGYINSAVFIMSFLMLAVVLQQGAMIPDYIQEVTWHYHHVYESLLWGGVMYVLLMGHQFFLRTLLVNRYFIHLGRISYSVYLLHLPIIYYLVALMKSMVGVDVYVENYAVIALLLASVITIVVSSASYLYVEKPFLKAKS